MMKKILSTLLVIGALGLAPVIHAGVGNGRISIAVFRDNKTSEIQYYEMSDAQLDLMNKMGSGGEVYNPASTTATWLKSFQYPAGYVFSSTTEASSSTSSVIKANVLNSFQDNDAINLFQYLSPATAQAAIAVDATSSSGVITATSQTWAHTVGAGSNGILFLFGKVRDTTATNLQIATYNGVQMSTTTTVISYLDSQWGWMMHLAAPASGTHNIVARFSSSLSTTFAAISYMGASQTAIPDSIHTDPGDAASNNYSEATAPQAAGSWLLLAHIGIDAAGCTGIVQGVIRNIDNPFMADSNGVNTSSISVTGCGNRVENKILISFAPPTPLADIEGKIFNGQMNISGGETRLR